MFSNTVIINPNVNASGSVGVTSFNERTGDVMPKKGDYTAEDVGAVASTSVNEILALTEEEYNALPARRTTTLYLIKE